MDMEFQACNLLCYEEVICSPMWSLATPTRSSSCSMNSYGVIPTHLAGNVKDDDALTIELLLSKQSHCLPPKCYISTLIEHTKLQMERSRVVRWMVKAQRAFNFSPLTAVLAVNYFDRYWAQNLSLSWKEWMVELLSVACLSVAAKMEEIEVPALVDLQIDGLFHTFQSATVQRMELALMNGLNWKLQPVTPFAFSDKAISSIDLNIHVKNSLLERVSELFVGTLPELVFVAFESSVIALSSMFCALEESVPVQASMLKAWLLEYIPTKKDNLVAHCSNMLEELVVDPVSSRMIENGSMPKPKSPTSPMGILLGASTAIETQRQGIGLPNMSSFVIVPASDVLLCSVVNTAIKNKCHDMDDEDGGGSMSLHCADGDDMWHGATDVDADEDDDDDDSSLGTRDEADNEAMLKGDGVAHTINNKHNNGNRRRTTSHTNGEHANSNKRQRRIFQE